MCKEKADSRSQPHHLNFPSHLYWVFRLFCLRQLLKNDLSVSVIISGETVETELNSSERSNRIFL